MAGAHIVVLRALPGLGDFLCAVPALRALRAANPGATIHLVGLESTRALVARFDRYLDRFLAFPGHPALPEQPPPAPADLDRFLAGIRVLRPALAIQLHGTGTTTNDLVATFGAADTAGFHPPAARPPDGGRFLPWIEAEPEPRRWLRLLRALGIPADDDRLEFPLAAAGRSRAARLLAPLAGAPYAVVHPGAAHPDARWGVDGFQAVARWLSATGLPVVLTGARAERRLTRAVATNVRGALDLGGETRLDVLGWIVRGARLVVVNDTGVAHLASALGTPSVVVFQRADPAHVTRWAPLDGRLHRAVGASVDDVLRETRRLLDGAATAA